MNYTSIVAVIVLAVAVLGLLVWKNISDGESSLKGTAWGGHTFRKSRRKRQQGLK
ncbi:hypothetical protein [Mucilaginibacter glaciei]|uniref:Uncharacterized protein n=1 Tax=Mucilaginibacter glaciei TaxID=2772109 RepID=A0A926NSN8_9SPHI|nr:hypothetical protein [Mucilaginibacter glaciei]MBD1395341.1 hypothetical protein [Mucilaginibacter glaciei]